MTESGAGRPPYSEMVRFEPLGINPHGLLVISPLDSVTIPEDSREFWEFSRILRIVASILRLPTTQDLDFETFY